MKRRLNRIYDHMTMPDDCSHRIENKLQEELNRKKTGCYTKIIAPTSKRSYSWLTAAAAVCLMLVISAGGTMLLLRSSEVIRNRSRETVASFSAEETVLSTPPDDYYSLVTDLPAAEVEAFAKVVRYNVLNENWQALSKKVSYPITIQDQEINDEQKFLEWMEIFALNPAYTEAVSDESCVGMFCNWQGICMADGFLWINEVGGSLKITAINVEIQEEPEDTVLKKDVPEAFIDVLKDYPVKFTGQTSEITADEYCAAQWADVHVHAFTVVDMDGDSVCEVVLSVQSVEGDDYGFVVLHLEDSEICAYPFRYGKMYDLKKDGTFSRSSNGPSLGTFRLIFEGKGSCQLTEETDREIIPLADWHVYPCQRADLVLQSYEHVTGTGWTFLPEDHYAYFQSLLQGSMVNDWAPFWEQLSREGKVCLEEDGSIYVFDPDVPGWAMYGVLTDVNGYSQLEEVGYYICTEDKEYAAEARKLLSGAPSYWIDAHLPFLGSMGRQVYTTAKVWDYLKGEEMNDPSASDLSMEHEQIRALVNDFVKSCAAGDAQGMKDCLAEDHSGSLPEWPFEMNVTIISYDNVPSEVLSVGDSCTVDLSLAEVEDPATIHRLSMNLIKQSDGWKVQSCTWKQ